MANDLISREAALEAARTGLKNFVGIQWTPENRHFVPKVVHGVRDALQNVPAIDAVEVVRCKDCKFYEAHRNRPGGYCWHWEYEEGMSPNVVEDDDFCSYGERRADNGN